MMSLDKLGLKRFSERGRGGRPKRRPCRMAGGTRPVFRPADACTA